MLITVDNQLLKITDMPFCKENGLFLFNLVLFLALRLVWISSLDFRRVEFLNVIETIRIGVDSLSWKRGARVKEDRCGAEKKETMAHSPSTSVKAIAAVAAAATLGVGLAGCGNNNSAVDANGKPVVTVLVVKNSNQAKMSKMGWARQLAKDTGVDIKWHEVSDQA